MTIVLLLLCVSWSVCTMHVHERQTLTIRRVIEGVSPTTVYNSCLCGWRDANFHLPLPSPVTLSRGDERSGRGFKLMRVPPFLIERCVDVDFPSLMEYGVANPGLLTYPVSHHRGRITFEKHCGGSTLFTWHVEWTPLRGCGWIVSPLTRWVVEAAALFTIAESERRRDGISKYYYKVRPDGTLNEDKDIRSREAVCSIRRHRWWCPPFRTKLSSVLQQERFGEGCIY